MSRELTPLPIDPKWPADVRSGKGAAYTLVGENRQIFQGRRQAANESA
jgi:hypothetical protein